MAKVLRSSLLLLLLALSGSGCATFESGELPGVDRWPEVAAAVPARERAVRLVADWREGAEQVLFDSGRCRLVGATAGFERRIVVRFRHARQGLWLTRIWMGVCAATATLVPARTVQYFELDVSVLDADGNELGRIERSVDGATWVGILTLFALPFAGGGLGELVRDTTRSVVVEAIDRGWL